MEGTFIQGFRFATNGATWSGKDLIVGVADGPPDRIGQRRKGEKSGSEDDKERKRSEK